MLKMISPRMERKNRPWPKSVGRSVISRTFGRVGVSWNTSMVRMRLKACGGLGRACGGRRGRCACCWQGMQVSVTILRWATSAAVTVSGRKARVLASTLAWPNWRCACCISAQVWQAVALGAGRGAGGRLRWPRRGRKGMGARVGPA